MSVNDHIKNANSTIILIPRNTMYSWFLAVFIPSPYGLGTNNQLFTLARGLRGDMLRPHQVPASDSQVLFLTPLDPLQWGPSSTVARAGRPLSANRLPPSSFWVRHASAPALDGSPGTGTCVFLASRKTLRIRTFQQTCSSRRGK